MKNLYTLLTATVAMAASLVLTSCEAFVVVDPANPDRQQSIAFAGQWTGDFGMYYTYSYDGRTYTFDSYDTDIVFYPQYTGATYGWGKQVDFYEYGPYESVYNRFNWEIRGGIVYLTYPADRSLDCDIYNYLMTADRFTGRFGSAGSTFSLYKIADYYNWACYTSTYSYLDRPGWYIGFGISGARNAAPDPLATDSLTTTTSSTQPDGIITYGKR